MLETRTLLTFGVGGVAMADVTGGQGDWIEGMALQSDGKIVAVGNVGVSRFNPDGSLDTSFNPTGSLPGFVRNSAAYFNGVAVQADGKIVVVGRTYRGNDDFLVHRYLANGALDPAFGVGGVVVTDLGKGKTDEATAVAIQADGKIVVVGFSNTSFGTSARWTVVRYTSGGALDRTFNKSGIVTGLGKGSNAGSAESVVLQPDGKIVVAGWTNDSATRTDFAVARYNANGSADTSFGGSGKVQTDFASEFGAPFSIDPAYAVALQADGRLVVAGGSSYGGVLARYNANGSLDTTFGGDGRVSFERGSATEFKGVVVQPDGKVVAVGGRGSFVAVRLDPSGGLDESFSAGNADGRDGWLFFQAGSDGQCEDVLIQPDGNILLAGAGGVFDNLDFALVRLTSAGGLDDEPETATEEAGGGETLVSAALVGAGDEEEEALLAVLSDFDAELLT